jgi:tetratricopeptide (TPR) repeat protein
VRQLSLILSLLLFSAGLRADGTTTVFAAGGQIQPWLSLSTDPRAAAMGNAVVASTADVQSLNNNPAGLNAVFDPQIAFTHNELDTNLGIRQEYLAGARRIGDGGIAASLNYISYGTFNNLDANGALINTTTDQAFAGTIGWGTGYFDDRLSLGIDLQGSQESLGSSISTLYTSSLGALYEIIPGLTVGADFNEIGLSAEGGEAPTVLNLGAAWQVFNRNLTLAGEWSRPNLGEASPSVGGEWRFFDDYAVRAGWRFGNGDPDELDQGFSAGAGIKLGPFQIDYAYVPYGTITPVQRISITMDLSEGLFGGNIVIAGMGVTQNAEAEYTDGKAAYDKGDWYEAKISLSRVIKIMPDYSKADEVKVMLADIAKKIAADKSHGMTPEQKAKIRERLSQAKELINSGDLSKARGEVEAVLEFDSSMADALGLLKQINGMIGNRVSSLKQEAIAALSAGDLQTAVLKYRAVLHIDDSDAEAISVLRKLSPRIREEVKTLHRKGIDLYISSDIEGAIALWEKALELDPDDPNYIRRDLEKAKKLLELRTDKN